MGGRSAHRPPRRAAQPAGRRGLQTLPRRRRGGGVGALGMPRMRAQHALLLRELPRRRRAPRRGVRPGQSTTRRGRPGGHVPGARRPPCQNPGGDRGRAGLQLRRPRPRPDSLHRCPGQPRAGSPAGREPGSVAAPDGGREDGWQLRDAQPIAATVGAAMYAGALAELAQQWLAGRLGSDLDAVVDSAMALVLGRL